MYKALSTPELMALQSKLYTATEEAYRMASLDWATRTGYSVTGPFTQRSRGSSSRPAGNCLPGSVILPNWWHLSTEAMKS